MAFKFQKASCIVVGTFNMYILHPQWLADHGIIEKGTEVGIETNFVRPGFRFHLQKYGGVWSVTPDRVVIESQKAEMDCGRVVGKVLEALPETPIFALGNNVVFKADLAERDHLIEAIRDFPETESPNDDDTVGQRTFHVSVKHDEHETTNLQLSLTKECLELSCNVHTKLDGRPDANNAAVTAAQRFFEHRSRSEAFAGHFWGVSIENDDTGS